jgi:hypothetical protein
MSALYQQAAYGAPPQRYPAGAPPPSPYGYYQTPPTQYQLPSHFHPAAAVAPYGAGAGRTAPAARWEALGISQDSRWAAQHAIGGRGGAPTYLGPSMRRSQPGSQHATVATGVPAPPRQPQPLPQAATGPTAASQGIHLSASSRAHAARAVAGREGRTVPEHVQQVVVGGGASLAAAAAAGGAPPPASPMAAFQSVARARALLTSSRALPGSQPLPEPQPEPEPEKLEQPEKLEKPEQLSADIADHSSGQARDPGADMYPPLSPGRRPGGGAWMPPPGSGGAARGGRPSSLRQLMTEMSFVGSHREGQQAGGPSFPDEEERVRASILHSMGLASQRAAPWDDQPDGSTDWDGRSTFGGYGADESTVIDESRKPWSWSGHVRKIQKNFNSDKWLVADGNGHGGCTLQLFSSHKQAKAFRERKKGSPALSIGTQDIHHINITGLRIETHAEDGTIGEQMQLMLATRRVAEQAHPAEFIRKTHDALDRLRSYSHWRRQSPPTLDTSALGQVDVSDGGRSKVVAVEVGHMDAGEIFFKSQSRHKDGKIDRKARERMQALARALHAVRDKQMASDIKFDGYMRHSSGNRKPKEKWVTITDGTIYVYSTDRMKRLEKPEAILDFDMIDGATYDECWMVLDHTAQGNMRHIKLGNTTIAGHNLDAVLPNLQQEMQHLERARQDAAADGDHVSSGDQYWEGEYWAGGAGGGYKNEEFGEAFGDQQQGEQDEGGSGGDGGNWQSEAPGVRSDDEIQAIFERKAIDGTLELPSFQEVLIDEFGYDKEGAKIDAQELTDWVGGVIDIDNFYKICDYMQTGKVSANSFATMLRLRAAVPHHPVPICTDR